MDLGFDGEIKLVGAAEIIIVWSGGKTEAKGRQQLFFQHIEVDKIVIFETNIKPVPETSRTD